MQRSTLLLTASMFAPLISGCDAKAPLEFAMELPVPSLAKGGSGGSNDVATRTMLPALSRSVGAEAYAINRAGTLIGGYSWDQAGYMHPVTWSQQNGTWEITAYPWDATATSGVIRGVNDQGDKGGTFWPASAPRPVIWHAGGGFTVLGCNELGEVRGMSSSAQVLVGIYRAETIPYPVLFAPGQCRVTLPPLVPEAGGSAYAVNGDGTIVGGSSAGVPVRWRFVEGAWTVEQLDSRSGSAFGSNSEGDLVGSVSVPCSASPNGCSEGHIWYATGGGRTLPTLGGQSTSPRAVNAAREVVGLSTLANGNGVPFIWSEALGILQLPQRRGGWAFAVSDVRADGTRVVAGAGDGAQVWVVPNP